MLGLGEDIRDLINENKRLEARKKRLLAENRKLRQRVKELEEHLAAAKQQFQNFQENILKDPKFRAVFEALFSQQGGW